MKTLFLLLLITSAAYVSAAAQGADDYNKNEIYLGYSNYQFYDGDRISLNGGDVSYTRNLARYFGIKGEGSFHFGSDSFRQQLNSPGGVATAEIKRDTTVLNVLGGIQIKDNNREKRFKPFVHMLVGFANKEDKFSSTCTGSCAGIAFPNGTFSNTGFAGAFGGGLDISLNDRIEIRAIKIDYNPIFTGGGGSNNVRFGAGIIFK